MAHIPVRDPSGDLRSSKSAVLPICLARLAALVPRPRVNLIRYYGVFAPNSRFRARVTPAGRGKGSTAADEAPAVADNEREAVATSAPRMTWAQRLRRGFRMPRGTLS